MVGKNLHFSTFRLIMKFYYNFCIKISIIYVKLGGKVDELIIFVRYLIYVEVVTQTEENGGTSKSYPAKL